MENYKKNLVELVSNIAFEYKPFPSPIPPYPQKDIILREITSKTPRATPESVGVSSGMLAKMLRTLEDDEEVNIHSIVVMKHGKIIAEASAEGYSTRIPHLSHSMSKSIVGLTVMMLCAEEKLDTGTLITDFFDKIEIIDKRMRAVSVKHLLTMTSGVGFGEAGVVSEDEWLKAFFLSDMGFSPGERFAYNSMNSYVLTAICDIITRREFGIPVDEYIDTRLFSALGIKKPHWERSPEGIIKGGFGLYLSCEEWAKIGCAVLDSMLGNKNTPIPSKMLTESIENRIKTADEVGDFDYGYHIWVEKEGRALLFNGMFGQNVLIDPQHELVLAINSGNNELFSKSTTLSVIRSILSENVTRGNTLAEKRALRKATAEFFENRRWISTHSAAWGIFSLLRPSHGAEISPFLSLRGEYVFPKNNHSILPSFVRVMQNNYTGGIRSFRIDVRGGSVYLISDEAAASINIRFGIYSHVRGEIEVLGEKYTVMAICKAENTPKGGVIYKFELLFPELPNSRRIVLERTALSRLAVKMYEMPDERIADAFVDAIPTLSGRVGMLYRVLEQNFGKNFIEGKLKELFSPEFYAVSRDADDYEAALAEENEKIDKTIASSRLVRSVIFNFLGNEEKMREIGGGALGKLAGIIGKFF